DFPAHAGQKFARLAPPIVDEYPRRRLARRTIAADDRRRHDRLVDPGRAAFGACDKPALALLLIRAAVGKPALERMPFGAAERVFDHRSARQQSIELACGLERVQIVTASDVRIADENLWHRRASARLRDHGRPSDAIPIDADF